MQIESLRPAPLYKTFIHNLLTLGPACEVRTTGYGYPDQCAERLARSNKNILFLGNSYTYGNDLPGMVRNLASAAGDENVWQFKAIINYVRRKTLKPITIPNTEVSDQNAYHSHFLSRKLSKFTSLLNILAKN